VESALRQGGGAPGLKLIETFAWDGAEFVRLDRHLARMARGAALLGWAFDGAQVRALLGATCTPGDGPLRVRVTRDARGQTLVDRTPLPAAAAVWSVGLAGTRLDSRDPWLTIKSTHRPAYDASRAALPPGVDELLFLNEKGQVCDGTITTVFFDRGRGLRTPPLSCGLLPGVLRAALLQGDCREEVLLAAELAEVRLWVGNSLRGLIPARFVGAACP
jgi:4-amino-4-deoxychorismate lyase